MVHDLLDLGGVEGHREVLAGAPHLHPLLNDGIHDGAEIDVLEVQVRATGLDG